MKIILDLSLKVNIWGWRCTLKMLESFNWKLNSIIFQLTEFFCVVYWYTVSTTGSFCYKAIKWIAIQRAHNSSNVFIFVSWRVGHLLTCQTNSIFFLGLAPQLLQGDTDTLLHLVCFKGWYSHYDCIKTSLDISRLIQSVKAIPWWSLSDTQRNQCKRRSLTVRASPFRSTRDVNLSGDFTLTIKLSMILRCGCSLKKYLQLAWWVYTHQQF